MKVIIAGGREFNNYELLYNEMNKLNRLCENIEVVSGTAKGADALGERWADESRSPISRYPADWDKYGKSAGYKRNAEMARYADVLVAFWDGKSKGTKHMIDLALAEGVLVKIVRYL